VKPPRIDSHQHFWRFQPAEFGWIDASMAVLRADFLPTDLKPLLDTAAIDGCIAVQAAPTLGETRFLLDLAKGHPWIRGVVGWVDLQSRDVDAQLREFTRNPRFVGVRHLVQDEPDPRFLLHEPFLRGLAALAPYDLAYDLLVRPHQLSAAIDLVDRFAGQRFVLDHCGKPDLRHGDLQTWSTQIHELARRPNVVCKLSGLATEADPAAWTVDTLQPAVAEVLQAFGPRRLLFGSDWPVCLLATSYARWLDTLAQLLAELPSADLEAVYGGNAVRCYHLPKPR
jgi:L-fuconolactonase